MTFNTPSPDVSDFGKRRNIGMAAEQDLKLILEAHDYTVVHHGQEYVLSKQQHAKIRFIFNDPTVRAIRHAPDLFATRGFGCTYWDAKTNNTPGTPNFAIEKDSYDELLSLATKGDSVYVAFRETDGTWYANTIQALHINRDMSTNRQSARGSRTPYLLISKSSTIPLNDFLKKLTNGI